MAETERYAQALDDLGIRVAAVVLNAVPEVRHPTHSSLASWRRSSRVLCD